jgi:hypothetical protein
MRDEQIENEKDESSDDLDDDLDDSDDDPDDMDFIGKQLIDKKVD